jgi:putative two-component system response regulator
MNELDLKRASILILDDDESTARLLERLLVREGYSRIHVSTRPSEALDVFARTEIDLVLLDLQMPELDGYQVMAEIQRRKAPGEYLPILVLTGNPLVEARQRSFEAGARDFLPKPIDPEEAKLRIRNLLETRFLHQALARQNETLELRVRERTAELEQAAMEILERLALVAEYYDDETSEHTRRVALMTERLALALGMAEPDAALLGRAAMLHDVGKIAVPTAILRKSGQLTSEERAEMARHAQEGARVLAGSHLPLMMVAEEVARSHHERWDGGGYPAGLAGTEIPLSGRIVAVADVFDALINVRAYKEAWTVEDALVEIRLNSGTQFDPAVVAALEGVIEQEDRYPPTTLATAPPAVSG